MSFVGAGPGDPELLTVKAHRRLMEADVIVHDHLVPSGILEMGRRDATRIPVGQVPHTSQSEINAILLREAQAGHDVVRLKVGDISAAGRGGEELAYLNKHGIGVDVVPGVAAPLASGEVVRFPTRDDGRETNLRVVL